MTPPRPQKKIRRDFIKLSSTGATLKTTNVYIYNSEN